MLVVSGIRIPLKEPNQAAIEAAIRLLGVSNRDVKSAALKRLSYDARHGRVTKVCSVTTELTDAKLEKQLAQTVKSAAVFSPLTFSPKPGKELLKKRPVIVGFGPAGMFAALMLAEYGYNPIVLERGEDIDSRKKRAALFFSTGQICKDSNVQFGEGGAGTFSDGKLTFGGNNPLCDFVLKKFVEFGAPERILHQAKPHIGSDLLGDIVKRIRERIINLGGEVCFESCVEDVTVSKGRLVSLTVNRERLFSDVAVVATGHSARDMVLTLHNRGAGVTAKSFAVGLRIEHLQQDIDRALWGKAAGSDLLPKAEYSLSTKIDGRAVYTFCMCPGGSVVAAASAKGEVVVNGMSDSDRGGKNANSAVVAAVDAAEFGGNPFLATAFQEQLEQAAFRAGGGQYAAPASDVLSFMRGRAGLETKRVEPTYPLGVTAFDLGKLLGSKIADPIRMAILEFSDRIRGFDADDAVLTGIESRTSSPVRIERRDNRRSLGIDNLYPCGEGAGYSGGIMSSAIDGLKTAEVIIERYRPLKG